MTTAQVSKPALWWGLLFCNSMLTVDRRLRLLARINKYLDNFFQFMEPILPELVAVDFDELGGEIPGLVAFQKFPDLFGRDHVPE